MVRQFHELFVNRRAYTVQSMRPHPETGRHYYFRPVDRTAGRPLGLTADVIRQHLEGEITIGLYAINPKSQRSKWVVIDADYRTALEDLLKLQVGVNHDGVEAALEKSRRGAHLWVLFREPVLAREARLYILDLAARLELPVKGAGGGRWHRGVPATGRAEARRVRQRDAGAIGSPPRRRTALLVLPRRLRPEFPVPVPAGRSAV